MIVNDRITAYIQSLDAGNGPLLDSIEEEALADCVLFGFTDEPCDAGKLPDHDD